MTVYKNMAFGLKLRHVAKAEIDQRVRQAAKILGIGELMERKPSALSGGQRQRVAVGRAIVRKPRPSCSTSRCRTWTLNCGWRRGPN